MQIMKSLSFSISSNALQRTYVRCIIALYLKDVSHMSKIVFHVDVNSAFLSWEAVYRLQQGESLDLRTIPSAVGGDPKKRSGIILAKSIPAKKYNIQTAETLSEAFNKCPHLTIVPPTYGLYTKCSKALVSILQEYTPQLDRYSIDECFMNFSNMKCFDKDPIDMANEIRERVHRELGFTVNIGVSENKLLAKMASDFQKPNRVHTLFLHEIKAKMWPLPVGDLFMVGRATKPKLIKMGIQTIGDLAQSSLPLIQSQLKKHGAMIWRFANGKDDSGFWTLKKENIKGIGNSTTTPRDVTTSETAYMYLLAISEMVAMRLREKNRTCSLISVSIRTSEFHNTSRQRQLSFQTASTNTIYDIAKELFNELWKGDAIRHIGVRVSDLRMDDVRQKTFFDPITIERDEALDKTIDTLRVRFGKTAITRGKFLHTKISPVIGGVGADDYTMMKSYL